MKFYKYHAIGNDYIVVNPIDLDRELNSRDIKVLCDRNYGIGADGVLYGPLDSDYCDFGLQIFNPDASEAEKSGNGLRIFSRYLWDCGVVKNEEFSIDTKGGAVNSLVQSNGKSVSVEMGQVRFTHGAKGNSNLKAETICVKGKTFEFYKVSVGNPHCVIPVKQLTSELAINYGKLIEQDSQFENRTNVQFMEVLDRNTIKIEIWERGAGYTLSSGSSSTAASAVAHALNNCDSDISVRMPGGTIVISLTTDFHATMTGPVVKIGSGKLMDEALE